MSDQHVYLTKFGRIWGANAREHVRLTRDNMDVSVIVIDIKAPDAVYFIESMILS